MRRYLCGYGKSYTFAGDLKEKGALAHLVERNTGSVEVRSSSLLCSTFARDLLL